MIQANELRIGNWISICEDPIKYKDFHKVTGLGAELMPIQVHYGVVDMQEYYPIPLTPEILEKCGFVKDVFMGYSVSISNFDNTVKILSFSGDYLYIREGKLKEPRHEDDFCVLWNKDVMKFFYLHQLQNLYFALTGEELKISL